MGRIVAHRGWSSRAPENTTSAIQLALDEERIDYIEIDVHLTKDKEIVVLHDISLDRVSNGSGYVYEYELLELRELDLGQWFDKAFTNQRISTLEEVLDMIDGKKTLLIEIKGRIEQYPDLPAILVRLLENYRFRDKILIKSFDTRFITEIHRLDSALNVGLLFYGMTHNFFKEIDDINASFVSICNEFTDQGIVDELIRRGIDIYVWTLNDVKEIERVAMLNKQIKLISDYPDRVIKILDKI